MSDEIKAKSCGAKIEIGDSYSKTTIECELSKGHDGNHRGFGETAEPVNLPFAILWKSLDQIKKELFH